MIVNWETKEEIVDNNIYNNIPTIAKFEGVKITLGKNTFKEFQ